MSEREADFDMPMPVAHSAFGVASYLVFKRNKNDGIQTLREIYLLILCIVLANLPDIDFLFGFFVGDPNRYHHRVTHSIFLAFLAGLCAYWIIRKSFSDSQRFRIAGCCILAAISHPVSDFFSDDTSNPFGLPLFWPILKAYYIAPFPLFYDVERAGGSVGNFLTSLVTIHNLWGAFVEILFGGAIVALLFAMKIGFRKISAVFLLVCSFSAVVFFYSLQIEPNWIKVKSIPVQEAEAYEDFKLVHLSDLHLSRIAFREKRLKRVIQEIQPDIIAFSGDTFNPFGEGHKTELAGHISQLVDFLSGLPGEKFLVWGEGICNNRHLLSKALSEKRITVLEDQGSESFVPNVFITGKLPELAYFRVEGSRDERYLTGGHTTLNSFLHYKDGLRSHWKDYDVTGMLKFSHPGVGVTFYSKYDRYSDRFYRIRLSRDFRMHVSPHGTGEIQGIQTTEKILRKDVWYRFRIRCESQAERTVIRARFWESEHKEPCFWDLNCWDDSKKRLKSGTIGIWVNGSEGYRYLDDFMVVSRENGQVLMKEGFEDEALWRKAWDTERRFIDAIHPNSIEGFNILLTHSPEVIDNYQLDGFDLVLAGDTHGGQICWPNGKPILRGKRSPLDRYSGLHNYNGVGIHVSKGIGTSRLPLRLFCRPEVTLFLINPI